MNLIDLVGCFWGGIVAVIAFTGYVCYRIGLEAGRSG